MAAMRTGYHRLARQSGGISRYAEVTVGIEPIQDREPVIEFGGGEFAWLKEAYGPEAWEWPACTGYRRGAVDGIQYALCHLVEPKHGDGKRIVVQDIRAHPAHSDESCVAYAACFATWAALGVEGAAIPRVERGKVIFPASDNQASLQE
jgi:hypothetical protein